MPTDTANAEKRQANAAKVQKVPGAQLAIPLGKELIVRIPGPNQSYRGKTVGMDPYDYLISSVRLPSSVSKQLNLGGQVITKFVHQGNVFGFRTDVIKVISSPAPLLFLRWPDFVEKIALRNSSRMVCNIDGSIETLDGTIECIVVNVSESGCRISARAGTRDPITNTKIGETMAITMTLGNFGTIKTPIAVRNIEKGKGIITIGAMFLDIHKDETAIISNFLDKLERLTR